MKCLIPHKSQKAGSRSIEISRAYLRTGETISRSLWVKVSPRHPLLKLVLALPVIGAVLAMFILIVLILGFTLLALALLWALSPRPGYKETGWQ